MSIPPPANVSNFTEAQTGMQGPYYTYAGGQPAPMMPMMMPQGPVPLYTNATVQTPQYVQELSGESSRLRSNTQTSQPSDTVTVAQNLAPQNTVVYAHPIAHPGGLSQSKSYHSGLVTHAANSPDKTPRRGGDGNDSGFLGSPSERVTEPRNYAPRAVTLQGEPPEWTLVAEQHQNAVQLAASDDPFVSIQSQNQNQALIWTPNSPPQQAISAQAPNIVELPGSHYSQHLTKLLQNGNPSFEVAMHPDNFPFVESCRTGPATNHGVIRIRNASLCRYHLHVGIALTSVPDSILHEAC